MFKKIIKNLKKIFIGNAKSVPAPQPTVTENPKSTIHSKKPYSRDKSGGTHHPREPRRRETREEYRLRHEKEDAESGKKESTPRETTGTRRKRETRAEYLLRHEKEDQEKSRVLRPEQIISTEPWDHHEFKVPVVDGKVRFHDFELSEQIMHAIFDLGFEYCTPVQGETLSKSLAGDDVSAQAQTGTGKTAAFLITIFNHLAKNPIEEKRDHGVPRALILAPTRELVLQIEKDARGLGKYVPCSILSLLGGIDYVKQQKVLKNEPIDILICTPGRLIDFMRQKFVDLGKVEILIIDEADRMLDMGFIPSVTKIVQSTPAKAKRQTMFFSATMSYDVKRLADSWTRQAFEITVKPEDVAVQSVEQITYITTLEEKPTLLYNLIMQKDLTRVLIFANRRDEAQRLKETLDKYDITSALLSGDVDQNKRIRRLEYFREGKVRVLIATDVASRGIHVEGISHVINYNLPQDVEDYVHRIGRTGRAGATGVSISFADQDSVHELQKLEEFLRHKIEYIYPEDNLLVPIPEELRSKPSHRPRRKDGQQGRSGQQRRPSAPRHRL